MVEKEKAPRLQTSERSHREPDGGGIQGESDPLPPSNPLAGQLSARRRSAVVRAHTVVFNEQMRPVFFRGARSTH